MEGFGRVGPFQSPYFSRVQNYPAQFLTSFQGLGNNMAPNVSTSNFAGPSHAFTVPQQQPIVTSQSQPQISIPELQPHDQRNGESSCGSNSKETPQNAVASQINDVGGGLTQDNSAARAPSSVLLCEHCNRKFPIRSALCEHLRAYHNVKKAYTCQEQGCNGSFMKQKSLDCHRKNVHHENVNVEKRKYKLVNGRWTCDICNKTFNSQAAVCNHRFFHYEPRFACIYCEKKFHLNGGLQRHLKRHRGEIPSQAEKTFPCPQCKRRFRKVESLKNHDCGNKTGVKYKPKPSKTKPGQFKSDKVKNHLCENCGKGYCSNESLLQHVLKAHGDNSCKQCSTTFDNPRDLLYHITETHNEEPPPELVERISKIKDQRLGEFLCEFCSKIFFRTSVFNKHMLIHYEKELQSQCPVCKTQLTSQEEVKSHIEETHKDVDLTKIAPLTLPKCQLCNKKFRNEEALQIHNNRLHAPKEKVCPYCSKVFSGRTKKAYYIHVRIHNGFKPYQCNHCDKRFAQKGNLNMHVESHLKDNPLYCRQCKILFVTKEKHQEHLNEKHIGKSKYICKKCYWGSDDKEKYEYHLHRNHRKEVSDDKKPHKCQFCPNRYTEWHSLRNHYTKCKANLEKIIPPPPSLRNKKQLPKNVEEIPVREEFLCKECYFVFKTPARCYYHFVSVHSNLSDDNFFGANMMVGLNRCDEETAFNKVDTFMAEETNSAFKKAPFFCKICHVFYASIAGFDRHLEWFHPIHEKVFMGAPSAMKERRGSILPSKRSKRRLRSTENEDTDSESDGVEQTDESLIDFDDNDTIISLLSDVNMDDVSSSDEKEPTGPVPNFVRCKICKKMRSCEEKLERHYAKRHPDEQFKIPDATSTLKTNTAPNFATKAVNLSCKHCFQHFKKFSYLKQHISKHHSSKNPAKPTIKDYKPKSRDLYLCKICKIPYSGRRGIIAHLENTHLDIKIPVGSITSYKEKLKEFVYIGNFGELKALMMEGKQNKKTSSQVKGSAKKSSKEKGRIIKEGDTTQVEKTSDVVTLENEKENISTSRKRQGNLSETVPPNDHFEENQLDRTNLNAKKFMCKVCNIGWGYQAFLDSHIKRWHPDYFDLYPHEKQSPESLLKQVMQDTVRMMKLKEARLTRTRTVTKTRVVKKKKTGRRRLLLVLPNQEPQSKNCSENVEGQKGYESSNGESEGGGEANQNLSSDTDSRENARDLSTKVNHEEPKRINDNKTNYQQHYAPDAARKNIYQVPDVSPQVSQAQHQPNHLSQQQQHSQRNHQIQNPPVSNHNQGRRMGRNNANSGDLIHNMLHTPGISNAERQTGMNNNNVSVPPSIGGPSHPYNNQLYQTYLSSFDQYPAVNQNPVFPTPSFGERPETQMNQPGKEFPFPDWDSIFTSPVKNKNVPITTMNTYNQSHHHNSQVHDRPPNTSHFGNANTGQHYPGMSFQNQSINHHQDPCLMTPQSGLHQPYLNPNIPSTSHHGPPNYSSAILQNQLIPLASVANYQGPPGNSNSSTLTLIGEKSAPRQVHPPQNIPPIQKGPRDNLHSDSEEERNIQDTAFGINYDSESSCDDPKKKSAQPKVGAEIENLQNKKGNDGSNLLEKNSEKTVISKDQGSSEKIDNPVTFTVTSRRRDKQDEPVCTLTSKELEEARSKVHFCKVCPMYYVKKKFLVLHYERDHPNSLDLIEDLKKETVQIQKEGNILTCRFCQKKWNGQYKLNRHIQSCHNEDRFQCNLCDDTFSRKHALNRHLETHFLKGSYKCNICDKEFKTQDTFEKHRYKHKENCPFDCPNCERSFSTEVGLKKHVENFCKRSYECPDCDLTFENRQELKEHSFEHSDNRVECPKCNKKFSRKRNLKNHIERFCQKDREGSEKPKRKYTKRIKRKKAKCTSDEEMDDSVADDDDVFNKFISDDEMDKREDERKSEEKPRKLKASPKKLVKPKSVTFIDSSSNEDTQDSEFSEGEKEETVISRKSSVTRPSRACRPKSFVEVDLDD